MKKIASILFLILFPSLLFSYEAKVIKTMGTVYILPYSKSEIKAKEGMELFEKDTIKTGDDGWIAIELSDKSKINIGNKSLVTIYKNKQDITVQIDKGKINAKVSRVKDREVTFKTSTAVAGIRGTEFMLYYENNANLFFGKEGKVEVKGKKEGTEMIGKDEMTETTRGLKPLPSQKVEPNTPLFDAYKIMQSLTDDSEKKDFYSADKLGEIIGRWNINYSRYLVDVKDYDSALHTLQFALDITSSPEIRADARLQRGSIFSIFLNSYEEALAEYLLNLEEYPKLPQAEVSLYNVALLLDELGYSEKAKERLKEYKEKYPNGRYINNVNRMLGE